MPETIATMLWNILKYYLFIFQYYQFFQKSTGTFTQIQWLIQYFNNSDLKDLNNIPIEKIVNLILEKEDLFIKNKSFKNWLENKNKEAIINRIEKNEKGKNKWWKKSYRNNF